MITITTKNPKEFAIDKVAELSTVERLDLDLYKRNPYKISKYDYVGIKAGRPITLPLDSVWEREPDVYIQTVHYDQLFSKRKTDKVLIHISPEEFSLEKRVCYPGEMLSYGSHNEHNKIPPSNGTRCICSSIQYQIIITSQSNIMVRNVEQEKEDNNPMCDELIYLNASEVEFENLPRKEFSYPLYLTRKVFLENILDKLPGFWDINLLTDKEYGREVRIIVPNNGLKLVHDSLNGTGYSKLEK